jgi:hypothetical protein
VARSDVLSRGAVRNPDLGLSPDELVKRYASAVGDRAGLVSARQARSVLPVEASDAEIDELARALVDQSSYAFDLATRAYAAEPSGEAFVPFALRRIAAATELYLRTHHFPRRLS